MIEQSAERAEAAHSCFIDFTTALNKVKLNVNEQSKIKGYRSNISLYYIMIL